RNVISGNTDGGVSPEGIRISNGGTNDNNVQGNFIGTNLAGTAAINNKGRGVFVGFGAKRTLVGAAASTPGQNGGNVIAGNLLDGVQIDGSGTTPATIQGNLVGTNAGGSRPFRTRGMASSSLRAPTASRSAAPRRRHAT